MTAHPIPLFPTSQHSTGILPTGPARSAGVRVGDTERTRTCDALALHFAEGRLSPDELDARLAAATTAVTQTDLSALLSDLPRGDVCRPQPVVHPQHTRLRPSGTMSTTDVLTLIGVIGSFGLIMLMMVAIGAFSPPIFVAAAFGGIVAALAGGGIVHLMHRSRHRHQPPTH